MSDSSLQQNAVSWHQVICFLSSCNYTNDVNEIHKIFIEWGIECMGNNTQLHHFTNYQSVVLFVVYIFIRGLLCYLFIELAQQTRLEKHFCWKVYHMPPVFTLIWKPEKPFFFARRHVLSPYLEHPSVLRGARAQWKSRDVASAALPAAFSGRSDDVTAHHIWTCHRSNSPAPSAHMNVTRKQSDWGQMAAVTHRKNTFFL